MRFFIGLIFGISLLLWTLPAAADCIDPVGEEGVLVYNTDHKVLQFCNGAQWIAVGGSMGSTGTGAEDKWESVDLADVTDFDTACRYKFRVGSSWIYAHTVTAAYLLFDASVASFKFGAIEKGTKGQYWYRDDGAVGTTSGTPVVINAMERRCVIDRKPDNLSFADISEAAFATVIPSETIVLAGINESVPVAISGTGSPEFSIDGGPWATEGMISYGQSLQLRLTSGATFGTERSATITVGDSSYLWTVNTMVADSTPDAFAFTDQNNVALGTLVTSNTVSVNGLNQAATVSVTGGGAQVSINGGAWGAGGTITNGQTLAVRLTSSASFSTTLSAMIDVGGVTDSWSVTTLGGDSTPDAFSFTDQTGVALNTMATSNIINIGGINTGVSVSVSGTGSPQVSIDGGVWGTSGTISNGQSLQVRLTSANAYVTTYAATVTVGGVSDTWSVQTAGTTRVYNVNSLTGCINGYCACHTSSHAPNPDAATAICVNQKGCQGMSTFSTGNGPLSKKECAWDGTGCFTNAYSGNLICTSVTCSGCP